MITHRFHTRFPLLWTALIVMAAAAPRPGGAGVEPGLARADDRLGGRLEIVDGGRRLALPVLEVDVDADVQGDLATVTVRQIFANPTDRPLNATYLFPLNENAAVFEMTMEVGDEIVRAQMREIDDAIATFEKAKREGRGASLLREHRPNMFTQEIANLMPELPVTVTLRYVQTVPRIDGDYRLIVPLVVGPRYIPVAATGGGETGAHDAADPDAVASPAIGQWSLDAMPAQSPVFGLDVPAEIESDRVSISVSLNAGLPIRQILSPTHAIDVANEVAERADVTLAEGRVLDNRDFELHYRLAGETVDAGLLAHRDQRGGFLSLLIEPPHMPSDQDITPREVVFVLDCSGSMAGLPIEASKAFMRQALQNLRPADSFRIIRFSDAASEFSRRPMPATPENVRSGLAYVAQLRGSGGTEMTTGIRQAFDVPTPVDSMRIVVFLTDGYIGNDHEILRLVQSKIGDARMLVFGVGTSVNRFLLSKLGEVGRGFTRYMDPTENPDEVARELVARIDAPVLTDIEIDWGGFDVTEVQPQPVPDLFAGQSRRVQARFDSSGDHQIVVRGRVNGRAATLPLRLDLSESADNEAIALIWARAAIAGAMDQLLYPTAYRRDQESDEKIRKRVTDLGLDFSLVSRWTAFVAVTQAVLNRDPRHTVEAAVPVPMVKGVTELAYPKQAPARSLGHSPPPPQAPSRVASGSRYSGSASPEPATTAGLLIAAGAGLAGLRRRRHAPTDRKAT